MLLSLFCHVAEVQQLETLHFHDTTSTSVDQTVEVDLKRWKYCRRDTQIYTLVLELSVQSLHDKVAFLHVCIICA